MVWNGTPRARAIEPSPVAPAGGPPAAASAAGLGQNSRLSRPTSCARESPDRSQSARLQSMIRWASTFTTRTASVASSSTARKRSRSWASARRSTMLAIRSAMAGIPTAIRAR